MDTNTGSPAGRSRHGLWNRWPATTISALTGLTALAVLMAAPPVTEVPVAQELDVVEEPGVPDEALEEEMTDEEAPATGTRHKGEEGKMGKPTSKSKSGLYAMKAGDFHASPAGASADGDAWASLSPMKAAGASADGDAWAGLPGTEIGEAHGVGGLGLVGTGRGGGGEGTIGLGGSHEAVDAGPPAEIPGSYDPALQSQRLTVGTVDDNADPNAYADALERLSGARAPLGIADDLWQLTPPARRHAGRPGNLDVALVIDTTGSMGDELEYLKVELRDIARDIDREFPGVAQRWALIVYRDRGDAYVTRRADFRDIDAFVDVLGRQTADGGGDTPEAMHRALAASERLSWHTGDDTARVVFLVADAPTHEGAEARQFATSVLAHRTAKTAIFPVAGSGVDPQAEAELRLAARVTGGQYIFLTDHSGVGGHHAAPQVDQYKVESLHAAMTRMIRGELGDAVPAACAPACDDDARAIQDPVVVPNSATSVWDELVKRLTAHLLFCLGMSLAVFAAMGVDTWIRRRRLARG